MSWSLSTKAPKAEAREVFKKVHQEQSAYQVDGSHKDVMDKIAAFAADLAEAAPDGTETSLSSNGHVNTDGQGSASVSVSFYKVAPTT
jgi:hypothetical protein